MQVIRAEAMGMCFGVRDALALTDTVTDPTLVTIHGELVHNEQVNQKLEKAGFTISGEIGRSVPKTPSVMITAHGVSHRERETLANAGKKIIDTTCPLVRRAHETALRIASRGWHVVVVGKRGHVEMIGLTGDLHDYTIIESPDEVTFLDHSHIGVVCQTTVQPDRAKDIVEKLRQVNPASEVRFFDTICKPTKDRQSAMADLLLKCDAVVVVGGLHSNNTRQLVKLAETAGRPVSHVQSAGQIDRHWASRFSVIGVTAGTSTPDLIIDAVCNRLEEIQPLAQANA